MRILPGYASDRLHKRFFELVPNYFSSRIEPLVLRGFVPRAACEEMIEVNKKRRQFTTKAPVGKEVQVNLDYRNSSNIAEPDFSSLDPYYTPAHLASAINDHWGLELEYDYIPEIPVPLYTTFKRGEYCRGHLDVIFDREMNLVRPTRRLSGLLYLNDWSFMPKDGCFTGGEINFPSIFDDELGQCVTVRPAAGDVVIFPTTPYYYHSVSMVTSGVRHNIVTWMKFKHE